MNTGAIIGVCLLALSMVVALYLLCTRKDRNNG